MIDRLLEEDNDRLLVEEEEMEQVFET